MTEIVIDPDELDAMTTVIGEQAQQAAVTTLAYLLNAVDLGVRAQAVRTEQATPTDVAAPPVAPPPSGSGFMLDQVVGLDGQVRAGSGGIDLRALSALAAGGGTAGSAVGGFTGADSIRQALTGVRFRDGRPVDGWGSNDHSSSAIGRGPDGDPEVRA